MVALLPGGAPAVAARPDAASFTRAMLRELNRVRAAHHLSAVREDRQLDRSALGHSRDMARRGYFAHGAWASRVTSAVGRSRSIGEVLGWRVQGSPGAEARGMVRDWLASPPHRAVLLSGRFSRVGVGRAASASGSHRTALYTLDWAG
ncbi:MAG: CAP domain-containing protein [Actinobacteria bacterium]|nr:CAP domain-containing protein [Actinomycetota bacterium]